MLASSSVSVRSYSPKKENARLDIFAADVGQEGEL